MSADIQESIRRVLAGDNRCFQGLVERHAGLVWAICSTYAPLRVDREDLAQETFIQCYLQLHTLRKKEAFGAWLSQLARRICLDWLRKNTRRTQAIARNEDWPMSDHVSENASKIAVRRDLHAYLLEEVRKLPPKTSEAMFLHYAEGLSVAEAAAQLGVTENSLSKRLAYGRQLISERVGDELGEAMATERHSKNLANSAMALIPFGTAPWTSLAGSSITGALAWKGAVLWGTTIMTKKTIVASVVVLALAGALFAHHMWRQPTATAPAQKQPVTESASPSTAEPSPIQTSQGSALYSPDAKLASPVPPAASVTGPESSQTETAVVSASISGTVKDPGHSPVNGALVQLEIDDASPSHYETTTDKDGHYDIAGIKVQDEVYVRAYASAEGFVMQREGLDLSQGNQVKDHDFILAPARFFIAGRVVSSAQRAIEGARVGTMHYGYGDNGISQMQESGGRDGRGNISGSDFVFAKTDATGAFLLALPLEGHCDVFVTAEGCSPAYYPAVPTGTEDALFVLPAGGSITGRVTGVDDKPVRSKEVVVQGHAYPGGLDFGVQELPLKEVVVLTDANGQYLAEQLGEDFVYSVSVKNPPLKQVTLPTEQGVAAVAEVLEDINEMYLSSTSYAAQRTGIRVKAGLVTSGIDLKLSGDQTATITGKVTDRSSGAPVAALAVMAVAVDERVDSVSTSQKFGPDVRASAVSLPDGTYSMTLQDLEKKSLFAMTYEYFTEGGSAWEPVSEVVKMVELGPGEKAEVDLRVDAPVTVPVRYLDAIGAPVEGILAAMRQAGAGGGCGGSLISDAEGRVEFHGIKPDVLLEALAWKELPSGLAVLGASQPFQGRPGERVAEVIVECIELGGLQGLVLDPSGAPLANTEIIMGARLDQTAECLTGDDGRFVLAEALPEGAYPKLFVGRQNGDLVEIGMAQNVEIAAGMLTDLGTIALQSYTQEAAMELLR
ncbi:MAG: sigma-70 family RNA polymerase sigma factor [Candidatus Hydrogenedentes bacterium]|nr:sigma-70 family RNA polymerase sigma factor [Candidatus Hydrogenedentota bacterium]